MIPGSIGQYVGHTSTEPVGYHNLFRLYSKFKLLLSIFYTINDGYVYCVHYLVSFNINLCEVRSIFIYFLVVK